MDDGSFDNLTRRLASGWSRRSVIKGLLGLTGGAAIAATQIDDSDARRRGSSGNTTPPPESSVCAADAIECGAECCTPAQSCCDDGCCDGNCTAIGICCSTPNAACGPDCCTPQTQCCGGECCDGACYGEELCCPAPRLFNEIGWVCCDVGTRPCGEGCVPENTCCTDDDCTGLTDACNIGRCPESGGACYQQVIPDGTPVESGISVCLNGSPCVLESCPVDQCGPYVDLNCGQTIQCPLCTGQPCTTSEACASGTCSSIDNTCCEPHTACPGDSCGEIDDGCGGTISCGGCGGASCSRGNDCASGDCTSNGICCAPDTRSCGGAFCLPGVCCDNAECPDSANPCQEPICTVDVGTQSYACGTISKPGSDGAPVGFDPFTFCFDGDICQPPDCSTEYCYEPDKLAENDPALPETCGFPTPYWCPVCEGNPCVGEQACAGNGECVDGTCCTSQCDGKSCGDNGCGGTCGTCPSGFGFENVTCVDGICVQQTLQGICNSAFDPPVVCPDGLCPESSICLLPPGAPCTDGAQCREGFSCIDCGGESRICSECCNNGGIDGDADNCGSTTITDSAGTRDTPNLCCNYQCADVDSDDNCGACGNSCAAPTSEQGYLEPVCFAGPGTCRFDGEFPACAYDSICTDDDQNCVPTFGSGVCYDPPITVEGDQTGRTCPNGNDDCPSGCDCVTPCNPLVAIFCLEEPVCSCAGQA